MTIIHKTKKFTSDKRFQKWFTKKAADGWFLITAIKRTSKGLFKPVDIIYAHIVKEI